MEKLSSVMDIASLADEFASKIQNSAILEKCFPNNKCNLLHSAFAWKDKIHLYQEVESTNILAREALEKACEEHNIEFYHPSPIYCTDNAAMIGVAAYYEYKKGVQHGYDLNAVPNLKLGERI